MRFKSPATFLVLFLSLTVLTTTTFAASALSEAQSLEKSGDKAGALEKYREAVTLEPESFAAEIKLARLLKSMKQYPEAITHYKRAMALSEGRKKFGVKKELATVTSWTKDKAGALRLYAELLEERPKDSEARMGLARVYSWTGRYDEAIRGYRDILKDKPGHSGARVGLINVLRWKGETSQSLAEARKFLSLKPENSEARRLVRQLRKSRGPYVEFIHSDGEDSDDNRLVRNKLSGYFSVWDSQVLRLSYSTYHASAPFNREADAALFTVKSSYKATKLVTLTPRLSIASLDTASSDGAHLLPGLSVRWKQSKRLTISTSYSQSMLMDTAQLIGNALKLNVVSFSGSYHLSAYSISSGYKYSWYPDKNFSNRLYVNLSKGFIDKDPKLSGGVRLDYVDFNKNRSNGYYDPQQYLALTAHATLEDDYYDRRLFYQVIAGGGVQTKKGTSAELKASLKGKLTWHFTPDLSAWVAYKWSRSALESTTGYNYNAVEIGMGYLF